MASQKRDSRIIKIVGLLVLGAFLALALAACGGGSQPAPAAPAPAAKDAKDTKAAAPAPAGGEKAAGATVKFRHAVSFSKEQEDTTQNLGTYKFKELLEKYGNGKVAVDVYASEQLGSQQEVSQKVQAGALEIAHLSTQNLCQLVPIYNLVDFPFMFPSREKFAEVMTSAYVKDVIHKEVEKKGVKVLWYCPTAFRSLGHTFNKTAKVPDDIQGMKVRVTGSAVEQESFRLAGAKPTPISWSETYTAMQQKVVDGVHVGLAPLYNNKIHETFKRATNLNMMLNSELHIMNKKLYDSLPADVKEALDKAAGETGSFIVKDQGEKNKKMEDVYRKANIELYDLTEADRKAWIAKVGHQLPAWDKMKDQWGREYYTKLAELASK